MTIKISINLDVVGVIFNNYFGQIKEVYRLALNHEGKGSRMNIRISPCNRQEIKDRIAKCLVQCNEEELELKKALRKLLVIDSLKISVLYSQEAVAKVIQLSKGWLYKLQTQQMKWESLMPQNDKELDQLTQEID